MHIKKDSYSICRVYITLVSYQNASNVLCSVLVDLAHPVAHVSEALLIRHVIN